MEETGSRDGKDGRNSKWQKEDGREQRGEGLEEDTIRMGMVHPAGAAETTGSWTKKQRGCR